MEQQRLFLAIGLSLLVFVVWQMIVTPKVDVNNNKNIQTQEDTKENNTVSTGNEQLIEHQKEKQINEIEQLEQTISLKTIKTPLYEAVISNKGAVLKSLKLIKYKESMKEDSDSKEIISEELINGILGLDFQNKSIKINKNSFYLCTTTENFIKSNGNIIELKYLTNTNDGITIEKVFKFLPDSYLIDIEIKIINGSSRIINDSISLSLINEMSEKTAIAFEGPSIMKENNVEQIKVKSIEDKNTYKGNIKWTAIEDRYFLTSLIIPETDESKIVLNYDKKRRIVESSSVYNLENLYQGNSKTLEYKLYAGPKKLSILKKYGYNLEKIVNFGWFDFIAKPCLMMMNFIYNSIFSNFGIAIIILTIIFKIAFWPLGNKSYKSMNDMKKLQPLVAEIREKYKNDKTKMNQEMMELYKVYKVNPLSGCLPMLVQLPIFFAFYRMLYSAIELRHAPFFGWIQDLSAPDRLGNFGFSIPFLESPTGLPVLTVLMGASMFFQQKMSPPAGDPTQAKMMMLMPLFMVIIFVNFSSGLVLYWLVNNLISIAQQYYVMKKNA